VTSKNFLFSSLIHLTLAGLVFLLVYQKTSQTAYVPFELQLDSVHVHHFDSTPKTKSNGIALPKKSNVPVKESAPTEMPEASTANEEKTGGPTGPSDTTSRYLSQLLQIISHQKFYPKASLLNEETGIVEARLTLDANGSLLHAEIKKSSGFPNLDAAALKTIQSIANFPAPPPSLGTPLSLSVPIRYELNPDH
jgi:protein TonB